jgi:hypothetical protein
LRVSIWATLIYIEPLFEQDIFCLAKISLCLSKLVSSLLPPLNIFFLSTPIDRIDAPLEAWIGASASSAKSYPLPSSRHTVRCPKKQNWSDKMGAPPIRDLLKQSPSSPIYAYVPTPLQRKRTKHDVMAEANSCSVCMSLDLSYYRGVANQMPQDLALGTLESVKQRCAECSFCALVEGLIRYNVSEFESSSFSGLAEVVIRPYALGLEVYVEVTERNRLITLFRAKLETSVTEGVRARYGGGRRLSRHALLDMLRTCEQEHGRECNMAAVSATSRSHVDTILFIDVQQRCLVSRSPAESCRYFALSYVWGNVNMFMTTKDILPALMQVDALPKFYNKIPKLIQDAIMLTSLMDVQYLWVDSLCIVCVCLNIPMKAANYFLGPG